MFISGLPEHCRKFLVLLGAELFQHFPPLITREILVRVHLAHLLAILLFDLIRLIERCRRQIVLLANLRQPAPGRVLQRPSPAAAARWPRSRLPAGRSH